MILLKLMNYLTEKYYFLLFDKFDCMCIGKVFILKDLFYLYFNTLCDEHYYILSFFINIINMPACITFIYILALTILLSL